MENTLNILDEIVNMSTVLQQNFTNTNIIDQDKISDIKNLLNALDNNNLDIINQRSKMDPYLLITTRFNNPIDYIYLVNENKDEVININNRNLKYLDYLINSRELSCIDGQNHINQQILEGIKKKYGPNSEDNFLIISKYRADTLINNLRNLNLKTGPYPLTADHYLIEKVLYKLSNNYILEINTPSPIVVTGEGKNIYETATVPSYIIFLKQIKGVCIGVELHSAPDNFIKIGSEDTWDQETWDQNKLDLLKDKAGLPIDKQFKYIYDKVTIQGSPNREIKGIMGEIGVPIY